MTRRATLIVSLLLAVLLALPATAADRNNLSLTVTCTGFTTQGGSITLDRDNTGAGRERFSFVASDGNGTTIYSGPVESFYVGATISFPTGLATNFTATPAANPIVVSLVSAAGNGVGEQVVYTAAGSCPSLPTGTAAETVSTGPASPSVPVNVLPPSDLNSDAAIAGQPGYLVVNTSYLNLRSGDGPEYTIVGRVRGGDKLIALGRNDDFSWWYVQAGDLVGWAISDYLIARLDLTDVPVVIPAGEIALPRFFLYSSQSLLLSPSAGAPALCTIPGNLEYEIVGRNGDVSMLRVIADCGGTLVRGWLRTSDGAVRNPGNLVIPTGS